jgi:hypothetical protein
MALLLAEKFKICVGIFRKFLFLGLGRKSWPFGVPKTVLREACTELLKPHKTSTNWIPVHSVSALDL